MNQTSVTHKLAKRQFGIGMILGCFVTNIWSTVLERVRSNNQIEEIKLHALRAEDEIKKLNGNENVTSMQLRAVEELASVQSKLIQEHINEIEHFVTGTTVPSVVMADLIAGMNLIGSYIDMIHRTAITQRLYWNVTHRTFLYKMNFR